MIDLNGLAKESHEISKKRGLPYSAMNNEQNLKHAAGELIEAAFACAFYKSTVKQSPAEKNARRLFADELMDVVACIMIVAHSEGIDIEESLLKCIEKNKKRTQRVI